MQKVTKIESTTATKIRWLFCLLLIFATGKVLQAQQISSYTFSSNNTASLEDLSTGATNILTGNNDDVASGVFNIGFNFYFAGTPYSQFSVNSNGQFQFGPTAITSNVSPAANTPRLFPMTGDNEVNNGIRYKVLGSAPNRKFVCEWNQFYVYYTPNLTNAGNMQVWLYEADGRIDFVDNPALCWLQ